MARRLAFHSIRNKVLPKHLTDQLLLLRDPKIDDLGEKALAEFAGSIRDPNFRILVDGGEIHVINRDGHWRGGDPFVLFDEFATVCGPLDPAHTFYLGYELSKARTALTLGKRYVQDEALQ